MLIEGDRSHRQMPTLNFDDLKKRVAEHIKVAVGAEDFDITSAKLEEIKGTWSVDVEYKKPKAMFPETAFLVVDATTGEVKEFQKGK
jgi:hypothetical protein